MDTTQKVLALIIYIFIMVLPLLAVASYLIKEFKRND